MKALALVPLLALGCTTSDGPGKPALPLELGNPGRLAIAGNCIVVAEHASVVCVPRSGGGDGQALVTRGERTYVAIVADGDDVIATSTAGGQLFVDRISPDGSELPLANAPASAGAGVLAIANGAIFVSTGDRVLAVAGDASAAPVQLELADAPPIAALAFRGTTLYYVDGAQLFVHDFMAGTPPQSSWMNLVDPVLAADTNAAVLGHRLVNSSYSFVENLTTNESSELHGSLARVAIADGHAYAIVDVGIADAAKVDVLAPIVAVKDAYDLAADEQYIYWITRAGTLDRIARP